MLINQTSLGTQDALQMKFLLLIHVNDDNRKRNKKEKKKLIDGKLNHMERQLSVSHRDEILLKKSTEDDQYREALLKLYSN